jgi:protein-S-isoprenylcysteine O-methyltransferase Ste14
MRPASQKARIHLVQAGALILALMFLLTQPMWDEPTHEIVELLGFWLLLACVGGRMWSIIYVESHGSGQLVTLGPYSMTRNPLYFFSTVGAVGVGLIYGSLTIALTLGLLAYLVLLRAALREVDQLAAQFGPAYDAYARETPVFWPRLSAYRDSPEVNFSPEAIKRAVIDGLIVLAAFPLIETFKYLQGQGYLPILMKIA